MDPLIIGAIAFGAVLCLLFLGIPVALGLGMAGVVGLWLVMGDVFALSIAQTLPFGALSNYTWAVLPMFVLMGNFAAAGGLTDDVFEAAEMWLARLRGGMYLAVIAGSASFAAASGSTIVNAVVFTRLALPRMLARGYSRVLSIGSITAAGTFAAMIPPSLTMVIYAIMTEQSVGGLLLAGVIPGLLSAALYAGMILTIVRVNPGLAPRTDGMHTALAPRLRALRKTWGMAALVCLVLGGIYTGAFAPSAAGAIGAAGAFVLAVRRKGLHNKWVLNSLTDSANISCSLLAVIVGGLLFSRFLVAAGVIDAITVTVAEHITTRWELLTALCIMYMLLGCVIDTASMMIVTLPFVYPLIRNYGIDPIWFGVVFTKLIEIAVVTPPVGLNLYAAMAAAGKDVTFRDVALGVLPFVCMDAITLVLLLAFPALSTWLPSLMI